MKATRIISIIALVASVLALTAGAFYYRSSQQAQRYSAATPAERGWILMEDQGCTGCHQDDSGFRAPLLKGLYGSKVTLTNGSQVIADEAYIRESLTEPKAKVSAGYAATMPSFSGRFTEEELAEMIEAMRPGVGSPPQEAVAP